MVIVGVADVASIVVIGIVAAGGKVVGRSFVYFNF